VTCGADLLDDLAADAIALAAGRRRAVLGIAGSPGSGKSTLVGSLGARIAERMGPSWVAHVPMDGFHLADVQLSRLGLLGRKGAPDTFDVDGYANLLHRVVTETGRPVYAPGFERDLEQPLAAALVVPAEARLVLTEGNYLLLDRPEWAHARQAMSSVWFVTGDEELRVRRLVTRHVEFGKDPAAARAWVAASDQPNADLVAATRGAADRVIVNDADGWQPGDRA
jgi:pantothenate kinase